jgi:hypothetical protein
MRLPGGPLVEDRPLLIEIVIVEPERALEEASQMA